MKKVRLIVGSIIVILGIFTLILFLIEKSRWKNGIYFFENEIVMNSDRDIVEIPIKMLVVGKDNIKEIEDSNVTFMLKTKGSDYMECEYKILKNDIYKKYSIFVLGVECKSGNEYDEIAIYYNKKKDMSHGDCNIVLNKLSDIVDFVICNLELYIDNENISEIINIENGGDNTIEISKLNNELFADCELERSDIHNKEDNVDLLNLKEDILYNLPAGKTVLYKIDGKKIIAPKFTSNMGDICPIFVSYNFNFNYTNQEILDIISGGKEK